MAQKKQTARALQGDQASSAASANKVVQASRAVKTIKTSDSNVPVYPLGEIMQQSEVLMGVKPEVLAGAFHHMPGDMSSASLTVQEAKKQVQLFMNRKVK